MSNTIKCRVRAIIEHDGKLLLVQHKGYDTWCLPGGGIDPGEGLVAALERELMEELGVKAEIGALKVVHQFKKDGVYQGPEFFFAVNNPEDFLRLDIINSTHGAAEIAIAEFRDPHQTPNLRPAYINELLEGTDNQLNVRVELEA